MGWRTKLVCLLIVYCAGFATAIYFLAPTPDGKSSSLHLSQVTSAVKAQDLAKSFNSGIHKCLGLSKEATEEAAKMLRAELDKAAKSDAKG